MSASFHPRDDLVLSASLDQSVRVWDIQASVVSVTTTIQIHSRAQALHAKSSTRGGGFDRQGR
jgi:WD40 repeat protein